MRKYQTLVDAVMQAIKPTTVGRVLVVPVFYRFDQTIPTTVEIHAGGNTILTICREADFFGISGGTIYINAASMPKYTREINAIVRLITDQTFMVCTRNGMPQIITKREPMRWFAELC